MGLPLAKVFAFPFWVEICAKSGASQGAKILAFAWYVRLPRSHFYIKMRTQKLNLLIFAQT